MKREPTVRENIFANNTSDKGLISKIYKELIWLHSKKTKNPIKKMDKFLETYNLPKLNQAESESLGVPLRISESE